MWGYSDGAQWSIRESEYLASIATSSREVATAVMENELAKHDQMRRWMFDALVQIAWGWHGQNCSCPLEQTEDPVVRVEAVAGAIREMVERGAEQNEMDGWQYTQKVVDMDSFQDELLDSATLREHLEKAQDDRAKELSARKRMLRSAAREP